MTIEIELSAEQKKAKAKATKAASKEPKKRMYTTPDHFKA
jgi:hypothetical protein